MPGVLATIPPSNHSRGRTATLMDRYDHLASAVRAQVAIAFPQAELKKISRLPNAEQHPLHRVDLSDDTSLTLGGPALPNISGMAISSYSTTQAEAIVLGWLACRRDRPSRLDTLSTSENTSKRDSSLQLDTEDVLSAFLPQLVSYFELDTGPAFFGAKGMQQRRCAYNLTIPTQGVPVSLLEPPLSRHERQSTEFQCGRLLRMLSDIQSPNGRFGFAAEVLSEQPVLSKEHLFSYNDQRPLGKIGHQTWSDAYERLLLEARDEASRKKISSIPFARLHIQFERFRCILDHVMRPRLVVLCGGDDSLTLAQRCATTVNTRHADGRVTPCEDGEEAKTWVEVTGFQNWSNLVFGDPLIAKALCNGASKYTITGFTGDSEVTSFSPELPPGLVDDRRYVTTRLLLYQCYWAIKDIVKQPVVRSVQGSQIGGPSPAWFELSNTLAKLEGIASPTYSRAGRSRKVCSRKRRRSESPVADGPCDGERSTRNLPASRLEARRFSTP